MRNASKLFVTSLILTVAMSGSAFAVTPILKEFEDAFVMLHESVRPCVVNIDMKGSTEVGGTENMEDLFKFFGIPQPDGGHGMPGMPFPGPQIRQGTGSGFIYDKEGHIVTNNHVVEGAKELTVRLWDGSEHEAEVVGTDPDTDIAVIKIDPEGKDLPVAVLGDSDALRVGQFAIAMGSPQGLEGSLSFGHISALGRDQLRLQGLRFQGFIQTDAAINLGNSGGPLCDIDGEVIGINIAIVYGANSLGFAIPINTAKNVLPALLSEGKVTRGYLGVGVADARLFMDGLNLPDDKGAFVKQVQPGTPAEQAGLQAYDVIRKVDGEVVENASDLIRLISAHAPEDTAKLEIWRQGAPIEKDVKLTVWAGSEQAAKGGKEQEALGLQVRTLTADLAERMGLEADQSGAAIVNIEPGSAAQDAGMLPGDVVTEVGQEKVTDAGSFVAMIKKHAKPGKSLLIGLIRSDGEADITVIKVPKDAEIE